MQRVRQRVGTVLACLILALGGASDGRAQTGTSLTLLSREGRRPVPITVINNQEYVAVDDLAGPFGTTAREAAGGLTITAQRHHPRTAQDHAPLHQFEQH